MPVIRKIKYGYKVYLEVDYTEDELSRILFDSNLRFVRELSKPLCYKRCILAEKR